MAKIKGTELTDVAAEVLGEDLAILDEFIEEEIEPLLAVGSPEKLLGKKYEEWTPGDFAQAQAIYGEKLDDFIARKKINEMYALESEEV